MRGSHIKGAPVDGTQPDKLAGGSQRSPGWHLGESDHSAEWLLMGQLNANGANDSEWLSTTWR